MLEVRKDGAAIEGPDRECTHPPELQAILDDVRIDSAVTCTQFYVPHHRLYPGVHGLQVREQERGAGPSQGSNTGASGWKLDIGKVMLEALGGVRDDAKQGSEK